jgi:hypothetical protein
MDDKESKVGGRGHSWTPIAVAVIGAFLGSSGTVALVFSSPIGQEIARPDPFTGSQAAALIRRLENVEEDLHGHVTKHPDDVNQFDRRITTLEVQYASIIANQGRIIERLDRLNGVQ